MTLVFVAIGGAIGSMARYLMQSLIGAYMGDAFPYATLLVNISGSVLMGLLIGWLARATQTHQQELRLFLAVGVLGGYTTFSSFSLDAIFLFEKEKYMAMSIYVLASVAVSLVGLFAGLRIMRLFA
jgi:CrcB protein